MFCTKCGYQIKDGYKFCPKCGTPVFVEQEDSKGYSKVKKEDVDKVAKVTNDSPSNEVVLTKEEKKVKKTILNPLIAEELDIEGVMKMAEKGDRDAMLRQAFRYEMGIGVKKDAAKAGELYEKAGGKLALPLLERSHINCILPNSIYEDALSPTKETNDDKDNILRVIPFVKDIILDYANKIEQDKTQGKLTKEKSIEYRNEFIQRMKVVRDLHPELLLANIGEKVTEEDVNRLFDAIKESTSSRYSLKWIPSLSNFSDYVDGNRFDIPSIYEIKSNGLFTINYLDEKDKINLLNQFVYKLLLQIPIKKIRLTFVDLQGKYEYDNLLRQLNPIIYNEKPVTTKEQFDEFLNRLEDRKYELLNKYGNYPEYCENNHEIPIPYEFIFYFNNDLDIKYEERLLNLYSSSFSIGIQSVIFVKNGEGNQSCFNNQRNDLHSKSKNINYGVCFICLEIDNKIHKSFKGYNLILKERGPTKNQLIFCLRRIAGLSLEEAKNIVKLLPYTLKSNVSNNEAQYIKKNLEDAGAICEISDATFNWNDLLSRQTTRYKTPILQCNNHSLDCFIKPISIADDDIFTHACINYINREAVAKEITKVVSLVYDASSPYENIATELIIDVGKKGKDKLIFRMDLVSHVHSFIIGQSGSGKSVFLHNIIGGAMLKYAPEDLQLYLLDFKLGGVEFNRYQGAKHVKALLVDNSDPQVTLEILRELRGSMTERGKLLRSAGVNNIGEYNKLHQQDRMPHVLVVADECHEMFKADDSIPRQVRNEISDIVIKIAKEGRSQGVHLVFATQTLSGTEISSEIINNVSDFYLLKCAQTDSERLVPNSSAITSELSTGQIYYHHVDEQVKFQAYYTDKEAAEKLMAAIMEKAKDHKSNGEFYFNGAQMFYLDESVREQMQAVKGKSPVAFMGKAIDISQKDLYIKLNEDFSENVLLLGLNDQEQVTRTTMNLFVSLMMSAKLKHKDIAFKVIDCLNNEEGEVHELIFDLENEGYCEIIERRQRSKFFKELAQGVQNGTAEETILLILGQDRFRELKMDMELEESTSSKSSDDDDMMSISDDFFGDSSSSSTSVRTYRDALNVILEKGPDYGVHTLLQIEKASNLLFEDYITPKVVFQKFKHLVMLKSDETAGVTLHLNDEIRLEKLSSDWERLRAYYYAEESDSYMLFTPYMPSKSKDIINLLKTI